MRFGVLGNPGSWYFRELTRAAEEHGHGCVPVDYRSLRVGVWTGNVTAAAERQNLQDLDAMIVRTMPPGSLEQVVFRMDALQRLEASGVLVVNPPRSIEHAVDKFLTTASLSSAGLPVPPTVVCESSEAALDAFHELGGDVVVKPLFGAEGRGIVRVSDVEIARRVFRTLERIDAVLYVQRFIEHPGYDLRVLLLGEQVIGCMRRSAQDDFRTNVACRGRAEPVTPSPAELELAMRAHRAVGTMFSGVDLLSGSDGTVFVIEVNAVPGWRAFSETTGIDVAGELVRFVASRVDAGAAGSSLRAESTRPAPGGAIDCVSNLPEAIDVPHATPAAVCDRSAAVECTTTASRKG